MPHWQRIMLHGNRDKFGVPHTYKEIREFHQSWKDLRHGVTLTEDTGKDLIATTPGIAKPWKECGFHWAISTDKFGIVETIMLRPMTQNGAHCRVGNSNRNSIGILIDGDITDQVLDRLATLIKWLLKIYKIPLEGIVTHAQVDKKKNCFSVEPDIAKLKDLLASENSENP